MGKFVFFKKSHVEMEIVRYNDSNGLEDEIITRSIANGLVVTD